LKHGILPLEIGIGPKNHTPLFHSSRAISFYRFQSLQIDKVHIV